MCAYDVLAVGSYSVDLIFTGLPRLPELGTEVVGSGFGMLPGEAYTSVTAMHRLGLKVAWAADFGSDEFSQFALRCARQEKLDERFFVHHNRPLRRVSVAASFPHERSFLTYYDPDPAVPAALKALALTSARLLFVPGLYHGGLLDAALKLMRLKGMQLVMDGNSGTADSGPNRVDLTMDSVRRAIQSCQVFLPNAAEARRLTGQPELEQAIQTLGQLCPLVVVKDGANGSYACQAGQIVHAPSIPVTPLDTTGAGDCFNAGFVRAWLDGRPLAECLRWGNISGALSTLAHGGTGRVVTVEEIQKIVSSG